MIESANGRQNELCQEKMSFGFPIKSDTNRAVQPQKMAGGLKFQRILLSRLKNKGIDQHAQ